MGIYDEIAEPLFNLHSNISSPATGLPSQVLLSGLNFTENVRSLFPQGHRGRWAVSQIPKLILLSFMVSFKTRNKNA